MLTPKTRFSRRKEYFLSEIVFYSGNLSFCREKLVEIPVFIRWKIPFRNQNTTLTPKTRFSRRKEYFLSEIVFYSGNLSFCREKLVDIPVLIRWKILFRNKKIPVLIPKKRFSRPKECFLSEILFYSGSLNFCREKLVEIPVFIRWNRPFRNKNTKVITENEVFSSKRVLFI